MNEKNTELEFTIRTFQRKEDGKMYLNLLPTSIL